MLSQKSRRCDDGHVGAGVNFHVTVLKILVSYPDGFAALEDLKRDMAILATSGRDWTERTRRLAGRVPGLDIFSQRLIDRTNGGWRITAKGRAVLDLMEARPDHAPIACEQPQSRSAYRRSRGTFRRRGARPTCSAPSPTQRWPAGSGVLARNERHSQSLS